MNITIKSLPISGPVKVFDKITGKTIYSGTEDVIPVNILHQVPELVYSVDDCIIIDVKYQKVYYDTEADWYYYESFFRSQYDERDDDLKASQTFEEFMAETLKYEPIWEVCTKA